MSVKPRVAEQEELELLRAQVDSQRARLSAALASRAPVADVGSHAVPRTAGGVKITQPMLLHGLSIVDERSDTRLYLGGKGDEVVRAALALVESAHNGRLATAIRTRRNSRAFGLTLSVGSDVLYVSGEEADVNGYTPPLLVRLERADGTKGTCKPIVDPYEGWATRLPVVVALFRDGTFIDERDSDGETAGVVRVLAELRNVAIEVVDGVLDRGGPLPFETRIRRFDDPFSYVAEISIEAGTRHVVVKMFTKHETERSRREVRPICIADAWAATSYQAARAPPN